MINQKYIAAVSGILFISSALAAPLSPADRDTVRQRQEQLLQQNQQQRDALERAVVLPRTGAPQTPGQDGGPCFTIHTITLPGATLISPAQQQALTAPWRDQCLNMARLPAGSKVYGGIPGQSSYYMSWNTLLDAGFSRESIFKSLQVLPHPEFGYRPQMGIYEVVNDITIPSGQVMANPLRGSGDGTQYFIKDYGN